MNIKNDNFPISLLTNQLEVRTKENIQLKEKIEKLTLENIKLKKENDYLNNRLLLLKPNKSNDFNSRLVQLEQRVTALESNIYTKNPWWNIPTVGVTLDSIVSGSPNYSSTIRDIWGKSNEED